MLPLPLRWERLVRGRSRIMGCRPDRSGAGERGLKACPSGRHPSKIRMGSYHAARFVQTAHRQSTVGAGRGGLVSDGHYERTGGHHSKLTIDIWAQYWQDMCLTVTKAL